MAHDESNEEINFQSQLNKTALDYYKNLLPDISLPEFKDDDFINTISTKSSIADYNMYPSEIQNSFNPNIINSCRRNSLQTTNKHNHISYRRHTLTETNHIANSPIQQQHQTTSNPLKHRNTTPKSFTINNSNHKPITTEEKLEESTDEYMINIQKYIQKHTKVFVTDKHENIDDLNMFKHNINVNIGSLMKYIVPKLKRLHSTQYVYGDLNPDNIWMAFDVDIDRHKPLKFCIFESLLCFKDNTRLLDTKYVKYIGNIGYNPPEILVKDKGNVFVKTSFDIWSLGICILELINGEHPFMYDLCMEYGEDIVNNGSLDDVLTQGYIDNMIMYNHILIRSKHKVFRDLLLKMLKVDVKERYTIDDIMNHKWYRKYCKI